MAVLHRSGLRQGRTGPLEEAKTLPGCPVCLQSRHCPSLNLSFPTWKIGFQESTKSPGERLRVGLKEASSKVERNWFLILTGCVTLGKTLYLFQP